MENIDDIGELISKQIQKAVKHALREVKSGLKNLDWKEDLHSKINFDNLFPFNEDFKFNISDTITQVMECVTDIIDDISDIYE